MLAKALVFLEPLENVQLSSKCSDSLLPEFYLSAIERFADFELWRQRETNLFNIVKT